jgi:hypothetical protein
VYPKRRSGQRLQNIEVLQNFGEEWKEVRNLCYMWEILQLAKVERLKKHKEECSNSHVGDTGDVTILEQSTASGSGYSSHQDHAERKSWLLRKSPPKQASYNLKQQKNQGVLKDTAHRQPKLDVQLGKFIYSANIPFSIVENTEFKKFCSMMRPSYTPATAALQFWIRFMMKQSLKTKPFLNQNSQH